MIPHDTKNIIVLADNKYGLIDSLKQILKNKYKLYITDKKGEFFDRLTSRDIDIAILNSRAPWGGDCIRVIRETNILYPNLPIVVILESKDIVRYKRFLIDGVESVLDISSADEPLSQGLPRRLMQITDYCV